MADHIPWIQQGIGQMVDGYQTPGESGLSAMSAAPIPQRSPSRTRMRVSTMSPVEEGKRDDWKHFSLPKLDLPEEAPWKKAMHFNDWMKRVTISANSVSMNFSNFTKSMFQQAEIRYRSKQGKAENATLIRLDPQYDEYDRKLSLLLLTALPERVITNCMRMTDTFDVLPCGNVLDVLFLHVSPGGTAEAGTLVQYARHPGTARTGREATDMLNEWKTARKRLQVVNMPDLAAMERVNAMVGIVKQITEKDATLNHRFSQLRYGTTTRAPKEEDATKMEEFRY